MAWFPRFVRSMLGQMTLLSTAFVGGGVYLLAVRPLLDMPPLGRPDLREATLSALNGTMWNAVTKGGDGAALTARIEGVPAMQQVQQRNPGFRYFALSGDVRVGTAAPRYLTTSGVAAMIAARRSTAPSELCSQWEKTFRRPNGLDHVSFMDCGRPRYFELRGIGVAIDVPERTPMQFYAGWTWSYIRGFLLPALGMFGICVAIIVVHIFRIRRIARIVRPIEDEAHVRQLSERGLPTELLPLIRAINRVIADSAAGEARRRFFLSAAAHEMRTPLTVLRTRLEMLDESEDRAKLIADVRRLARLVNDLLTLTRIGERPPVLVQVRLHAACRSVLDALDPVAMRAGVTLRLQGAIETSVLGDAVLIETAATNLIGNAIAVTSPGGTVRVLVCETGILSVRDEGPGIAADRVPEIFEPFVRLSNRHEGHGLGLAIVRAIADAHQATIDVDTTEGHGTCFTIRFMAQTAG